jgi:hypothetical protein
MENAVLRGTLRRSLVMGDRVLAGPHAQLTGGGIAHEAFIAADADGRRDQLRAALQRYTAAMGRHHRQDEIIPAPQGGR